MQSLHKEIQGCRRCELCHNMPLSPVAGNGYSLASIMFVNDCTSEEDSIIESPFQGFAGKFLDKLIISLKLKRQDLYFTNLVKCKSKTEPSIEQVDKCKYWLLKEISQVRPSLIITCGKISARTLIPGLKKSFVLKDCIGKKFKADMRESVYITPIPSLSYLMQQGAKEINRITELIRDVIEDNNNSV